MLDIYLLGDFRVTLDGNPVLPSSSPRLHSLCAYLVLHRHAPVSRSQLAYTFWPDSSEPRAFLSLRQMLHTLRHALPDFDDLVVINSGTVQWRPDGPFTLDMAMFERALAEAEAAQTAGDGDAVLAALQVAIDVYRGDLLPNCYDEWVLPERERLRERFVAALQRLIGLLASSGEFGTVIAYAQRLLRYDPLREESYRLLMGLYVSAGDPAGAKRVYKRCEATLRRELDVEPSQETRDLYDSLLENASIAPATVSTRPNNLPAQTSTFIGREGELAAAAALLRRPDARLVTFTGTPGTGKTRLALQVASDLLNSFEHGIFFVSLAAVTEPALVVPAITQVLNVREVGSRESVDSLKNFLKEKQILLVLDNFEQIVGAAPSLADLLATCADLKMLVTSRSALHLRGEKEFQVPPLGLPDATRSEDLEELARHEAVALFLERALDVRPEFALTRKNAEAVTQICRDLEGLPLAIELAAARVKMLSPQSIAARLSAQGGRLDLLVGGALDLPPRQRALRSTIAWSYDLLGPSERVLFRQMGVFVGGCTLETVEAICGDQGAGVNANLIPDPRSLTPILERLSSLIDNSLILSEDRELSQARFRMLETIREYALEQQAEHGEVDHLRRRHAGYFLDFAERAEPHLSGPEQAAWLDRLEAEHDNLRAALGWTITNNEVEMALRLTGALRWLWEIRGYIREGIRWLETALAIPEAVGRPEGPASMMILRAKALNAAGSLTYTRGVDNAKAQAFHEESLALRWQLGDQQAIASSLNNLGTVAKSEGDYERATALLEECIVLSRQVGDMGLLAIALTNLAEVAMQKREFTRAADLLESSLDAARRSGNPRITSNAIHSLGITYMHLGDLPRAQNLCEQSLALRRELGDKLFAAVTLLTLAEIAAHRRDYGRARALYKESLVVFSEMSDELMIVWVLGALAGVAAADQDPLRAGRLCGAIAALDGIFGTYDAEVFRVNYERHVAAARAQVDDAAWIGAFEQGRNMTLEQAVSHALED